MQKYGGAFMLGRNSGRADKTATRVWNEMLRREVLAGLGAIALAGCEQTASGSGISGGGRRVVAASELADRSAVRFRHLDSVNAIRAQRGLPQLAFSQALNSAAATHARDMSLQKRAWHFGTDRSNPQTRAQRAGFGGLVIGENIAETFDGDLATLQDWLDEPGASAIMLSPAATSLGLGWFRETSGKLWWVQLVGGPERT